MGRLEPSRLAAGGADPAPGVRRRAAELAPLLGPVSLSLLGGLLSDRDPSVVEAACFAVGEIGLAGAGTELRASMVTGLRAVATSHREPLAREAAVAAIGAAGATEALDAVLAALSDKPAIRRRAVIALAPFDGPEVQAALEAALADRDWQVRQAAEDLTGRRAPRG